VHNAQLSKVSNCRYQLLKQPTSLLFFEFVLAGDVAEELAIAAVLHNYVQAGRRLNDLVHLNNVRMSDDLEDVDFSRYSLYIVYFSDF
jgi:hypothetical protein